MTMTAAGFWWEAPSSLTAIFERQSIQSAFERYLGQELRWRSATVEDWPQQEPLTGDSFSVARQDGFGWVVEVDATRLFLVPRGFDSPEWSLAEFDVPHDKWRLLGDFEPLANNWSVPRLSAPA